MTMNFAGLPFSMNHTLFAPMGCAVWISVPAGASKFQTTFLSGVISVMPNW